MSTWKRGDSFRVLVTRTAARARTRISPSILLAIPAAFRTNAPRLASVSRISDKAF